MIDFWRVDTEEQIRNTEDILARAYMIWQDHHTGNVVGGVETLEQDIMALRTLAAIRPTAGMTARRYCLFF